MLSCVGVTRSVLPEKPPRRRVEREGAIVGRAVDAVAGDRQPVRAGVVRVEEVLPANDARLEVEREDVALHVLHVDDSAGDDRCRGENARLVRSGGNPEPPDDMEALDVAAIDAARGERAGRGEVVIRQRPVGAAGAARAASRERRRRGARRERHRGTPRGRAARVDPSSPAQPTSSRKRQRGGSSAPPRRQPFPRVSDQPSAGAANGSSRPA